MKTYKTFRLIYTLLFAIVIQHSEANANTALDSNEATQHTLSAESVINTFSKAVVSDDVKLFLTISDTKGIYLVRKFTSGNSGGRGSELSKLVSLSTITDKLQFPIKGQTDFSVASHFLELPIKSYKALPHRTLAPEIENISFDQWEPILKKSLLSAPEAVKGDPLLLISNSSKYWIYAEAQIIDGMLVGGFAVFSMQDGKVKLVSLIQLL